MHRIEYVDMNLRGGAEVNVYKSFSKVVPDTQHFILRYYQTMPKYYFLDSDFRTLLCHYAPGTGKTATSVFIASYYLKQLDKARYMTRTLVPCNKIVVLGSWVTINAFKNDILKPEFHFITYEQIESYKNKLNSPFKDVREEGEKEFQQLQRNIFNKHFIFKNFQGIFNMVFPTLNEQKYVQNVDSLIQGWQSGELVMSLEFLNTLRNTLIIIDECQNLWNQQGMNTYGFVIGLLIKKAEEYNIRFIFLSGTTINNNICELASMYSIMNPDKFIDEKAYMSDREILGVNMKTLNTEKFEEIRRFMHDKFLYYVPNTSSDTATLTRITLSLTEETELLDTPLPKFRLAPNDKTITSEPMLDQQIIPASDELSPAVWHLGNRVIRNENQDMVLYSLQVQGMQKQKYDEYLMNANTLKDDLEETDDVERFSLHDGVLVQTDDIYLTDGVYTGRGLMYPKLREYSAIGAEMVRVCLYNTLRGEKVICYHDKISKFGIKQYIEFLKINGYVEYGTTMIDSTRCQRCGLMLSEHTGTKFTHAFSPMCYGAIYGDISEAQRKKLVDIWNSPNNITGEVIAVMLISKVAYAGVSFYNTTNLMILNKINNMSKWKQICGRIVRTAGHSLLPKSKRIAKIYTMTIHSDIEDRLDLETKYYTIKNILNNEIIDTLDKLYHSSITDDLFSAKLKVKRDRVYNIFMRDLHDELAVVVKRIRLDARYPWSETGFIKRIQSELHGLSYINFSQFSDDFIRSLILEQGDVKMFRYKNLDTHFYTALKQDIHVIQPRSHFKIADLSVIRIESATVKYGIEQLINLVETGDATSVKNCLIKLLKLVNNNPSSLLEYPVFWKAVYMIHDEYYEGDETEFVKHHSTAGRDFNNIAGVYISNRIYLKDGTMKTISSSSRQFEKWDEMPYRFKISSYSSNLSTDGLWYLRVIIMDDNIAIYSHTDQRKVNTGLNCISFDVNKLVKHFPSIDANDTKREICAGLISMLCDYAIEKKHKLSTMFD